jgi:hypothetical protein
MIKNAKLTIITYRLDDYIHGQEFEFTSLTEAENKAVEILNQTGKKWRRCEFSVDRPINFEYTTQKRSDGIICLRIFEKQHK